MGSLLETLTTERQQRYGGISFVAVPFDPRIQKILLDSETLPVYRFQPPEKSSPLTTYYQQAIGNIIGDSDWKTKLPSGNLEESFTPAGWGHSFEAGVVGEANTNIIGLPSIVFEATGVAGDKSNSYMMKLKAHGAVQNKLDILQAIINATLIRNTGDHFKALFIAKILQSAGLNNQQNEDVFTKLNSHPNVAKYIAQLAFSINLGLFDESMVEELNRFRKAIGIVGGYSANVATIRGRNGTHNNGLNRKIISGPVDLGYVRDQCGGLALSSLLEWLSHAQPISVPDEFTAKIASEYFGINNTFVTGDNVGEVVDQREALKKWKNTKKERIILGSTSGHGANVPELEKAVNDFTEYKENHNDPPYSFIVFAGCHKDDSSNDKIQNLVNTARQNKAFEITANWNTPFETFKQQILAHKGELILVGTEDILINSMVKRWLEEIVHIEMVKPGEAHVMNPHVATVTNLLEPKPPNEPYNGIHALLKGGSIPRSPVWKSYVEGYLSQSGYSETDTQRTMSQIPGLLEEQLDNTFEAFDIFFGDNDLGRETNQNIVRQVMLKGLLEMENGTIPILAIEIAHMLEKNLKDVRSRNDMQKHIKDFHRQERDRKRQMIEELFPEDLAVITSTSVTE